MNRSSPLALTLAAILAVIGLCSSPAYALDAYDEGICGPILNNAGTYVNGPYDYRKTTQANKDLVERYHFNDFEKAIGTSKDRNRLPVWDQIEYTLRIFPNSPRALAAIDRLSVLMETDKQRGMRISAECAFLRAERFTPDDPIVRLLHGLYLNKRGRVAEAVTQLNEANRLAPDNPSIQYNLGLAYFQIKDYQHAREHAAIAYDSGYALPGLRDMLMRAGYWEEKKGPDQSLPQASTVAPDENALRAEPETLSPSKPDTASAANQR